MSGLTGVQRWAERAGYAVNNVPRRADKGVGDMTGMMKGACEDGGVGEVEASMATWAETEE